MVIHDLDNFGVPQFSDTSMWMIKKIGSSKEPNSVALKLGWNENMKGVLGMFTHPMLDT